MPAATSQSSPSIISRLTGNPRGTWLLFVAFTAVYLCAIVAVVGLHREAWHDEDHFSVAVQQFGNNFSIDQCRDYDEVNPPLFFMLYAAWGKLVGFDLAQLRLLSLLLSFIACLVLYRLLFFVTRNARIALLAPLVMMFNPYYLGISIFIYPDLLALVCVLLLLLFLVRENMFGMFCAAMLGLLARQYFIFVILAAMMLYAARFLATVEKRNAAMLAALAASMIPLCVLIVMWHGLAPPAGIARWNPENHFAFHASYATLYVCCFAVYAFPILIARRNLFSVSLRATIILAAVSLVYWVIPVEVSGVAKPLFSTVGFFHRLLEIIFRNDVIVHLIFFLCFAAGLHVVYFFLRDGMQRIARKQFDPAFFLDASIIIFLLVMPLSYQVWEKYFLPVVPIVMVRLMMEKRSVDQQAVNTL